jgi:hypothetical protein
MAFLELSFRCFADWEILHGFGWGFDTTSACSSSWTSSSWTLLLALNIVSASFLLMQFLLEAIFF